MGVDNATAIEFPEIIKAIKGVVTLVLFDLSKEPLNKKDTILRNTISKCTVLLTEIEYLHNLGSHHNASILYRVLLERLAHIHYLKRTESFDDFIDWSFKVKYEYRNTARGDERFKEVKENPLFKIEKHDSDKYRDIQVRKVAWKRPDVKTEMKMMKLDFLYKFGYDYSSQYVHPMDDDGLLEFHLLTNLKPNPFENVDYKTLSNSILTSVVILEYTFDWLDGKYIRLVYAFLDNVLKHLKDGSDSYRLDFLKITSHGASGGRFFQR
jgi:hypothetical protein